jgi:aliphatic sulfonates family ABC transporter substrate-binding protein
MNTLQRSTFLSAVIAAAAAVAALPARAQSAKTLRIGYQKDGVLLLAKQQGTLAARLQKSGVSVEWVEFQSGPPMLEALNGGGIDIGQTGDTPPIFAQAAGAKLVYLASAPDAGKRSGIVVHADGGIKNLLDLKGKRVAFTKASSAHNFVVRALTSAGLTYADIQPVYLQPADAAAAFRQGSVDAWGIWDPFFALAERFPNTRTLVTAEKISPTNRFFLAAQDFVDRNPDIAAAFVEEIDKSSRWAGEHPNELAALFSAATGVDLETEKIVAARDIYRVNYLDAHVIKQQQGVADTFLALGLIPHAVDVRAIAYVPSAKARAEFAASSRG